MREVFLLEHVYETTDEEDEIKFIGIFASEEKAIMAVGELKTQPGFRNFPESCFKIEKIILDHFSWKEGFVS